jgi:hypothetical protein
MYMMLLNRFKLKPIKVSIIIFSCHTNLKFLSTSSRIYVDGTFPYCTNFFKQLFTVHGYKNGHYVPLVTDKTAQSYEHCFQFITSLCLSRQLTFAPIEIVIRDTSGYFKYTDRHKKRLIMIFLNK